MSELNVSADEFFNLSKSRGGELCAVKFCRNPRRKDRYLCHKCNMRLWRARNPMRDAFNNLRHSAVRRKIPFGLTLSDFEAICVSTGYLQKKGNYGDCLHIDRIKNHLGYTPDNIRVITCTENIAKGNTERKIMLPNGRYIPVTAVRAAYFENAGTQPDYSIIERTSDEEPFPTPYPDPF